MKRMVEKIQRLIQDAARALLPNRGRSVAVARVGVRNRPVIVTRRRR